MRLFQHQLAVSVVYRDGGAGGDAAFQEATAQHGFYRVLHIAAQRTGTELGVVGLVYDVALGGLGETAGDLLLCQTAVELVDLQIDDARDVVLGQGLVEHDLIQTVQEFGAEVLPQQQHDPFLGGGVDFAVCADAAQ